MRQIYADEMKRIQIEILDVVMKFCDEHDILCFLDGGTLLGAVRHKGYIPWDDDIDIGMLREDYDKFTKLFNAENTRYKFVSIETDPDCLIACGRVYDTHTAVFYPDRKTGIELAINLDIWVMDNAPDDDRALRKMFIKQYVFRMLHHGRYVPMSSPPHGNIIRKFIAYCVRIVMLMIPISIMPKNYFAVKMLQNSKQYNSQNTRRVGSFMGGHELVMDKEKFSNFIYADFEGKKYKIPSGYDEWLTKLYGDYMKPPSDKGKESLHHYEAFIKDENGE